MTGIGKNIHAILAAHEAKIKAGIKGGIPKKAALHDLSEELEVKGDVIPVESSAESLKDEENVNFLSSSPKTEEELTAKDASKVSEIIVTSVPEVKPEDVKDNPINGFSGVETIPVVTKEKEAEVFTIDSLAAFVDSITLPATKTEAEEFKEKTIELDFLNTPAKATKTAKSAEIGISTSTKFFLKKDNVIEVEEEKGKPGELKGSKFLFTEDEKVLKGKAIVFGPTNLVIKWVCEKPNITWEEINHKFVVMFGEGIPKATIQSQISLVRKVLRIYQIVRQVSDNKERIV